jgi:SAM-dependent methyltransferase
MKSSDKSRVIERYNQRLAEFGDDIRTLSSGTEHRRNLRYQVLCEVGLRDGVSVLDLGCGFGDLVRYMRDRGLDVEYEGCDINPSLIEIAQRKYPDETFFVADIQNDRLKRSYDFVLSSSAFNNIMEDEDQYVYAESIISRAFALSREGVAIDFMTNYVDFKAEGGFYYSPEHLFRAAKKLTKRVCLRHDYPLFEFCLYLYKDFSGWRK